MTRRSWNVFWSTSELITTNGCSTSSVAKERETRKWDGRTAARYVVDGNARISLSRLKPLLQAGLTITSACPKMPPIISRKFAFVHSLHTVFFSPDQLLIRHVLTVSPTRLLTNSTAHQLDCLPTRLLTNLTAHQLTSSAAYCSPAKLLTNSTAQPLTISQRHR